MAQKTFGQINLMAPSFPSNDSAESSIVDDQENKRILAFLSKYGNCPTFDCKPLECDLNAGKRKKGTHFLAIRLKSPGVWDQVSYCSQVIT